MCISTIQENTLGDKVLDISCKNTLSTITLQNLIHTEADTQSLTKPPGDTNPSQYSALSFALRLEATLSSGLP